MSWNLFTIIRFPILTSISEININNDKEVEYLIAEIISNVIFPATKVITKIAIVYAHSHRESLSVNVFESFSIYLVTIRYANLVMITTANLKVLDSVKSIEICVEKILLVIVSTIELIIKMKYIDRPAIKNL